MEGSKEEVAREFVALYGRDASKMLRDRAAVADEYGDNLQAKAWREIAAIVSAARSPGRPSANINLRRGAILARTIGKAVAEPNFDCLMVWSGFQHHMRLG